MSFEPFIAARYFSGSGALALVARIHIVLLTLTLAVLGVRSLFPPLTYPALILTAVCLLVVTVRYLLTFRSHVALISTTSILGLEVGVAALVIALALLSGFQDRIRAQMAIRSPHVVVSPERGDRLPDPEMVRQALTSLPGVLSVDPLVEGRGWISTASGRTAVPVRYRNISEGPLRLTGDGVPPARVSAAAASRLGIDTGSLLRILSSRTRLSPIGPIPIAVLVRAAEIRRGSALEKTADVEVPEATARLLAGLSSGAQAYEAKLADAETAGEAARSLAGRVPPGYRVRTWRELNAPLAFALRLEKAVIFATVALVIVVAALNIISNIALLVVEKKRDLGVLISLGARPGALGKVYLLLGGLIGAIGTSGGVLVGVVVSVILDRFRVVPLPPDVYLMTHVPFTVHPREVVLVTVFSLATAIAAAVLPARAASRLAPREAVRLSR